MVLSASLLLALCASPAMGAIRITEFMAENDGFLHDADGDSPDWIEIHNDSPQPASLAGWHLTDDPTNLTKWTFPAVTLGQDSYLVVFASGKDRAIAGAELHANFQLDNGGEFLALVEPDGTTLASAFSPAFPPQRANASYGTGRETTVTPLITTNAIARWLVPTNGDLGAAWQLPGFDDSSWSAGALGLGYDAGNPTNSAGAIVLSLDFNERGSNSGMTPPGFSEFLIGSVVSSGTIQTNPTTRTYGSLSVTLSNTLPMGYDDRIRTTPVDSGAFTNSLLLRDFVFSRSVSDNGGLDLLISGLPASQPYQLSLWSFDTGSPGSRISDWYANGLLVRSNYTFDGNILPASNDDYRFDFTATSSTNGQLLIQGRRNSASSANNPAVFINALRLAQIGLRPFITTDVESAMRDHNASMYLRVPFQVADPTAIQRVKLRMKYNDGYAAYLNGQLIAARNITNALDWNSHADSPRPPLQTAEFEDVLFNVPDNLLAPGTNILAIQGLNVGSNDLDFLILPELQGLASYEFTNRYFKPATPGTENNPGYSGFVEDTKFSVDRGFYDTPFSVAVTSATALATIYWTLDGSAPNPTNGQLYMAPISITNTACLRAAAFAPDLIPTDVDTHTYLFLSSVLRQPAVLSNYPTVWQASYPADYEMDSNVVNSAAYGPTLSNDLRSIPTLSIVSEHWGLWSSSTGIYPNAVNVGDAWERAASAELILPEGTNGTTAFAANCGLRMHGNASRDNNRLAKHAFNLLFQSKYGPSKLHYDWFAHSPVDKFDTIVLLESFCDSWATRYSDQTLIPGGKGTRYRPEDSIYLRDTWMKDSQLDMGHLSAHGSYVHLYLNGLYWGIYNPCEHLDASFAVEHLGGRELDWDVLAGDVTYNYATLKEGTKDDWNAMMAIVNAGVTNETAYQQIAALVDVDNLIDYMLLHIFAEAEDWPTHNWYAIHRHSNPTNGLPATKWQFLVWDQEISLDQLVRRNQVDVNNSDTPARIYSQLRPWPEFRRLFGDRIQKHLFNQGALTPSNNIARLMARAAEIDRAIVGESARWGDAREFTIGSNPGHGQTFTRNEWWLPEIQKLCTNYLQTLNITNIDRFRAAGLYPLLGAPDFNQFGGAVTGGFQLVITHTNTGGTIVFTTDGSDPRVSGTGEVSPTAQTYSTPVAINSPVLLRARVLDNTNWSALVETMFYPPQDLSRLVLSELMYNPPDAGSTNGENFEFLELYNCGTNTLNLSGLYFSEGISFVFTNGTLLGPGEYFLLVRNTNAFDAKYPGVTVNGVYTGKLDNGGERLTLSHLVGGTVFSLSYDDRAPWPLAPDQLGFSLVPLDPCRSQASENGANWRASANPGGSPGGPDPAFPISPIFINEILSAPMSPQLAAVELFNPAPTNVLIGGWFLTDDPAQPSKYRIADGLLIGSNSFVLLCETNLIPAPGASNFTLGPSGGTLYLLSADAQTNFTGYSHGVSFAAAEAGITFGRYVNSVGEEHFPAQIAPTMNARNAGPIVGPVVINEIHYHPAQDGDEFVELQNITTEPVPLFNPEIPSYAWRLSGVSFTIPSGLILQADGLLLLVATNPLAFRAKYNIADSVIVVGPWNGVLQNNGERLLLQRPVHPETNIYGWLTVDEVRYNDKAPWPPSANGTGHSLQRRNPRIFGNEPLNWAGAPPTPGLTNNLQELDTDADGLPDIWEIANQTDPAAPDAALDPDGDGVTNLGEFQAGTDPFLRNSVLRFESVRLIDHGSRLALAFLAIAQKSYTVEFGNLLEPSSPMQPLVSYDAALTNRLILLTNDVSLDLNRFYRLISPRRVPPILKITSPSLSDTTARFSFSAEPNLAYRVEYQHSLGSQWTILQSCNPEPFSRIIWVTNQHGARSNYFYRVVAPNP